MKTNFPKQLVKPQIKTVEEADKAIAFLYGHVQSMTDTLIQVVNGGLSLSRNDSNLPLQLVRARVSSGISRTIPGYGASIAYVGDNAIVDKFAYRQVNENFLEITVLFDDDKTHDVVFLIVTERLPT
jgi:light-regulated signal transduction histidine kinase (bacteriophytochrome)